MIKTILKKILLALIFLTLPGLIAAGLLPTGIDEFEFIYDRLERIDCRSLDRFDYQLGPYNLKQLPERLRPLPFGSLYPQSNRSLMFFNQLGGDFSVSRGNSPGSDEFLRGGLAAAPHKRITIFANLVLDEKKANDVNYTGKKYRGLAGGMENGFVQIDGGAMQLTLGRFSSFWGVRRSLVLSSRNSLDGLAYVWRWGRLSLSYRLARLDGLSPERDSVAQFENRYFAGHRLDLHLSRRLRVGFFESVIFGGPGRQIELVYLNPLIFFHGSQLNEDVDDNTFLGFDFSFKPGHNTRLYGQLLIDDYQIDDTQADQEPSEYGLLAGIYKADFMAETDFKFEYIRVSNRTFNQVLERNRYMFKGQLIGAAIGNDYDQIDLSIIHWLHDYMKLSLSLSHRRQGEGRPDATWSQPWEKITGEYKEPFPTGVVERTSIGWAGLSGFVWRRLFVDVKAGYSQTRNLSNAAGMNQDGPFFNLKLSTFLSSTVNVD